MDTVQAPKFSIGQRVKFYINEEQGDNDGEAGTVVSFRYDPADGWHYTITARELDIPNKQIIEGVKHCREAELVPMQTSAPAQAPQAANKTVELGDKVSE